MDFLLGLNHGQSAYHTHDSDQKYDRIQNRRYPKRLFVQTQAHDVKIEKVPRVLHVAGRHS